MVEKGKDSTTKKYYESVQTTKINFNGLLLVFMVQFFLCHFLWSSLVIPFDSWCIFDDFNGTLSVEDVKGGVALSSISRAKFSY